MTKKSGSSIHKTAIVGKKVRMGKNVAIGPYSVLDGDITIGDETIIEAGAYVCNKTTIGKKCRIFQGAVIGQIPQDLKYQGEKTEIIIGDNNIFRECVTVNIGTIDKGITRIGNNNLFMAYSHVAHDCVIGTDNVIANAAAIAGFVEIQNKVVIGGIVAIHQYCRIGDHAIIGGCSKVVQDIPPFSMSDGHPAAVRGLNLIGLRRGQFSKNDIAVLKKAFNILFFKGHPFTLAAEELKKEQLDSYPVVKKVVSFISSSQRGIAR